MPNIEYDSIRSPIDAFPMQRLTLQDLRAGKFPHPTKTANPYNPILLAKQAKRFTNHPENYFAAYVDDTLEGYLKTGVWTPDDEQDFAVSDEEKNFLQQLIDTGRPLPELKLAIYGLVTSDRLENDIRNEITHNLFEVSTSRALALGAQAINIVIHDNDPVREVAVANGFEFTGRTGEAKNVKGVMQQLYSKPLIDAL